MDWIWGMGVDDVLDWSTRRSEGGGFHALEHNLIVVAVTPCNHRSIDDTLSRT